MRTLSTAFLEPMRFNSVVFKGLRSHPAHNAGLGLYTIRDHIPAYPKSMSGGAGLMDQQGSGDPFPGKRGELMVPAKGCPLGPL